MSKCRNCGAVCKVVSYIFNVFLLKAKEGLYAIRGILGASVPEAGKVGHILQRICSTEDFDWEIAEEKSFSSRSGRTSI